MVVGTKTTWALSLLYKSDSDKGLRSSVLTEGNRRPKTASSPINNGSGKPMLESIGTGKKMKTTVSIAYKKRSPL
jgi:hypothetical protein